MLTLESAVYSFDKNNAPIAHAANGDIVRFITQDCFGNQIKTEADHEDDLDFTHTNPATGPLYVDNADVGDVLAVDILDIRTALCGPPVRSGRRSSPSGTAMPISMM